jgi:biotin transporter BioY
MKKIIKNVYNTLLVLLFMALGVIIIAILTTIMFAILYEMENRSYFVSLIPFAIDIIAIWAVVSFFENIYRHVSWN